ncbi:MAG: GGDEF domain-containing protein [Deltaproteobacteria bacterium]|nr:GGDEF domain-containing protein [bacterium]MCB9477509.1 GGDEF domain-containing protein [Deltaproteobacteria bacterium]MCB9488071.1 GGDEF domain-containing protein [Deltaproteobacteria bacterium]
MIFSDRHELPPEVKERRHQLMNRGMSAFAFVFAFVALMQYITFWNYNDDGIVDRHYTLLSVSINVALSLLASLFVFVNRVARRVLVYWWEVHIVSLHVAAIATMAALICHTYLAGSQNTMLTMTIPVASIVVMWVLGRGWAWFYWVVGSLALFSIQALEAGGYVHYFPLAGIDTFVFESFFLDFRYRLGNGLFYILGSTAPLIVFSQLHAELDRSQRAVMKANQKLEILASTDSLTGLLIRRAVLPKFDEEIDRAEREKRPLSVVILDIDNFKSVNDTYGHAVGDDVLRAVADVLRHSFRTYDLVARIGGEEFMIVLPGNDLHSGYELAERTRKLLAQRLIDVDGRVLRVTASFGVAQFEPGQGTTVDHLMRQADEAHYEAKRSGKDRVCLAEITRISA